jgi:apolipoprotein N-acyltransferase
VGLIQGNIPTKIKSSGTGLNLAINRYVSGYKNLASQGADLIVTPETALPYRWSTLQRERDGIYQDLLTTNTPGLLGLFGSHDRGLTNSLFLLNPAEPDNPDPPHYDKVKLVPLGEYIPLTRFLGKFIDRLSPLDLQLIPGEPHQTLITPYGQVSVGICYESAFPKIFRWQTHQGGEFIVTASNNDYYRPAMAAQHHAQDVMRAIENDRWLVEATNTGYSAFVNPRGHTQWQSSLNQYQLKIYPLYRRQTQTIYIRWGDWLLKVLMIITGALWLGKLRSLSPRTMASSDQSNP